MPKMIIACGRSALVNGTSDTDYFTCDEATEPGAVVEGYWERRDEENEDAQGIDTAGKNKINGIQHEVLSM
jgi:hypothetical protein